MRNRLWVGLLAFSLAACSTTGQKSTSPASGSSTSAGAASSDSKGAASTRRPPTKSAAEPAAKAGALDFVVGEIYAQAGGDIPPAFIGALRTYLQNSLTEGGRLAKGPQGLTVAVSLSDYHVRGSVARLMSGLVDNADHVTAQVLIRDAQGKVVGESRVTSTNPEKDGGADLLAQLSAGEIARFLIGVPLKR